MNRFAYNEGLGLSFNPRSGGEFHRTLITGTEPKTHVILSEEGSHIALLRGSLKAAEAFRDRNYPGHRLSIPGYRVDDNDPDLIKLKTKLPALREMAFETLPACPGRGYVVLNDGFTARYLPGRNVVVVTASKPLTQPGEAPETLTCTLQTEEWNLLAARWQALRNEIEGADSAEVARYHGMTGIEFLETYARGLGVHQRS